MYYKYIIALVLILLLVVIGCTEGELTSNTNQPDRTILPSCIADQGEFEDNQQSDIPYGF